MALFATAFVTFLFVAPSVWIKRFFLLAPSIFGIIYVALSLIGEDYLRGFTFGGIGDEGYQHRNTMFEQTWQDIQDHPDGIGVGNFLFNSFTYPHNIFLEVLTEWGVIYGLFFVVFITAGAALCFFNRYSTDVMRLLVLYEFLNSQVSGDITSPRMLYALCLFGWLTWGIRMFSGRSYG